MSWFTKVKKVNENVYNIIDGKTGFPIDQITFEGEKVHHSSPPPIKDYTGQYLEEVKEETKDSREILICGFCGSQMRETDNFKCANCGASLKVKEGF